MLGLLLVLLSAVFFCVHNVIARILFSDQTILGIFHTGGFVTPSLPHALLLMAMRMGLVVPLMSLLSPTIYPNFWGDLKRLRRATSRPALWSALGCGMLMFLYLCLIYLSVGLIPAGIALTIFFTYPAFTALFSWRFLGSRPSPFQWGIMALILVGSTLTLPHSPIGQQSQLELGVLCGLLSGIVYALYTVFAQKSFATVHPVPFTWISFATTLVLSVISLLVWHQSYGGVDWQPLWIGSLLSAIATLLGHLFNNLGIRLIGATTAAMIGASNPALTVVLAWLTIQETLTPIQIAGVILVTLSVIALSRK